MKSVNMNILDDFPVDSLLEESTLDLAQVQALKYTFSHELALVQGPPGTGENQFNSLPRSLRVVQGKPSS